MDACDYTERLGSPQYTVITVRYHDPVLAQTIDAILVTDGSKISFNNSRNVSSSYIPQGEMLPPFQRVSNATQWPSNVSARCVSFVSNAGLILVDPVGALNDSFQGESISVVRTNNDEPPRVPNAIRVGLNFSILSNGTNLFVLEHSTRKITNLDFVVGRLPTPVQHLGIISVDPFTFYAFTSDTCFNITVYARVSDALPESPPVSPPVNETATTTLQKRSVSSLQTDWLTVSFDMIPIYAIPIPLQVRSEPPWVASINGETTLFFLCGHPEKRCHSWLCSITSNQPVAINEPIATTLNTYPIRTPGVQAPLAFSRTFPKLLSSPLFTLSYESSQIRCWTLFSSTRYSHLHRAEWKSYNRSAQ